MLLAAAPAAGAESMAIQPDGKIVLVGEMWPPFAALARVTTDGKLDPSFGQEGFVVDRRLPSLKSVALQPDGRILAGAVEGFRLARYLSDGSPDPSFGDEGIAGTRDPAQPDFLYLDFGPETILTQPGGGIVVGGTQQFGNRKLGTAIVRRYSADGTFLETVGEVPRWKSGGTFESHLRGLVLEPDGSAIGAGWYETFGRSNEGSRPLLARFVPGSRTQYDPTFGGGQGLVRMSLPDQAKSSSDRGEALAQDGSSLLVAGTSDSTFLLARFNSAGEQDQSFAGEGFARPAIAGSSGEDGSSWARAIAIQEDGRIVAGGGTSRWGKWGYVAKLVYGCEECPQPLLARFTADGQLDSSFGDGGLLRLLSPSGGVLEGEVEQVAALAGGKLLVKGKVEHADQTTGVNAFFLARLNPDGTYDPSFGEGGLTILKFPCRGSDQAILLEEGCLASAKVKLGVKGLAAGQPRLSLTVRPNVPWARIRDVELTLPKGLRPSPGLTTRSQVTAIEGNGKLTHPPAPTLTKDGKLFFMARRMPRVLHARLSPGALRIVGKPSQRRTLVFHVKVTLVHGESYALVGTPTVVLRRHGA